MLQVLLNRPYKQAVALRLSGRQPDAPLPSGGGFEKVLQQALFTALGRIALLKAAASGPQVEFATHLMRVLALSHEARQQATDFYASGRQARTDVLSLASQLVRHTGMQHDLLTQFLKSLGEAAQLDGKPGFPERILLRDVGEVCGFTKQEVYNLCLAGIALENPGCRGGELDRAYATLQLSPGADARQIKQAYRRLAAIYHPDKVQLRGDSASTLQITAGQFTDLQQAYELLRGARKMRA